MRVPITRLLARQPYNRVALWHNSAPVSSLYEPETLATAARIAAISGYGYTLSATQLADLDTKYKGFKGTLGRIPALWHDAEIGVNRNLCSFSEDFSNAAWSKIGTATITGTKVINTPAVNDGISRTVTTNLSNSLRPAHLSVVLSGTGTIDIVIRDGGAGSSYTSRVTLTSTPTRYTLNQTFAVGDTATQIVFYIRRLSGATATSVTADQFACGIGSFDNYQPVLDATTVKSLNLGTAGATGDGTFTNVTSASGVDFVGTRRVYRMSRATSQYISTGLLGIGGGSARFLMAFGNRASTNSMGAIGYVTGANLNSARFYRAASTAPVGAIDAGLVTLADPGNSIWFNLTVQNNGSTTSAYINGSGKVTSSLTPATAASGNLMLFQAGNTTDFFDGTGNHLIYDPNSYSDAAVLSLHNSLKSDLGL